MNSTDRFPNTKNLKTTVEEKLPSWVTEENTDVGPLNLENYFSNEFLEPNLEAVDFLRSVLDHKLSLLDDIDRQKEYMAFGHSSIKIFENSKHIFVRGGFLKFKIANLLSNLDGEISNVMSYWREQKLVLNNISIAHRLSDESELIAFAKQFSTSASLRKGDIPYTDCILLECDEATLEKQWNVCFELLPKYLGVKTFTVINSGNKSLHILIKLSHKITLAQYHQIMNIIKKIIFHFEDGSKLFYDQQSDPTVKIRVPGMPRFLAGNKVGNRSYAILSDRMQTTENLDETSYSFNEVVTLLTRAKDIVAIEHAPYREKPDEQTVEVKLPNITNGDDNFLDKRAQHLEQVELARMKYAPGVGYISSKKSYPCPICTCRNPSNKNDRRCVIDHGGYAHCASTKCEWHTDNKVNLVQMAKKDGYLLEYEKISCYNSKANNTTKTIDKYTVEYYKSWKPKTEVIHVDGRYLPPMNIDKDISSGKRLILEEAHTGGGKSTSSSNLYANILNVVVNVLPYILLKEQKYTAVFDSEEKLLEICEMLKITDEEKIRNILNATKEGRCFNVCPEGLHLIEDEYLASVERIEKATGLTVNGILNADEVHNIIKQGGDFRPAFIRMLSFANKHNMTVIGISATIQYDLPMLLMALLNITIEQIVYRKYVLQGQRKCRIHLVTIANNKERMVLYLIALKCKYDPEYADWKFLTQMNKANRLEDFEKAHNEVLGDECGSIWSKRLKGESVPDHVKRLSEHKELVKKLTNTTSCTGEGNDIKGDKIFIGQFLHEKDGTLNPETIIQTNGRPREAKEVEHYVFIPYSDDKPEVIEHKSALKLKARALENIGVAIHDDEVAETLRKIRAVNKDDTLKAYEEYIYISKIEKFSHMRNRHTRRKFLEADDIEILSEQNWNDNYIKKELARLAEISEEEVEFKNERLRVEMNALKKERTDEKKREERENVLKHLAFLQDGYMNLDPAKFTDNPDLERRHEKYLSSREYDDLSAIDLTKEDKERIHINVSITRKKLKLEKKYFFSTLTDYVRKCYYSDIPLVMQEYRDTISLNEFLPLEARKELRDFGRKLNKEANRAQEDKQNAINKITAELNLEAHEVMKFDEGDDDGGGGYKLDIADIIKGGSEIDGVNDSVVNDSVVNDSVVNDYVNDSKPNSETLNINNYQPDPEDLADKNDKDNKNDKKVKKDKNKLNLEKMNLKVIEYLNTYLSEKYPSIKKLLQSQLSGNLTRRVKNILFRSHIHRFIPEKKQQSIDAQLDQMMQDFEKDHNMPKSAMQTLRINTRQSLEKGNFYCMKRMVFMGDLKNEKPEYTIHNTDEGLVKALSNSNEEAKKQAINTLKKANKYSAWQLGGTEAAQIAVTAVNTCKEFVNKSIVKVQKIYNGLLIKVKDNTDRIRSIPMTMDELREKILYQGNLSVP